MANRLKMATVESILRLHAQGWSQRRIAHELHVDRKSVSRHVRSAAGQVSPDPKGANAPTGSAGRGRRSDCEPYRDLIVGLLDQGLSAQRIYQDLVSEHGFTARYWSVRRFVQASQRGWRYAVEHPDEAAGILLKWAPDAGLDFQQAAVRAVGPLVDAPQVPVGWIDAQRWQALMGEAFDSADPGYTMRFASPER
jgi:predicted transcriptional regulator